MLIACFEVFKKCIQENIFKVMQWAQKIGRRWNRGRGSGANVTHTQSSVGTFSPNSYQVL